MDKIIRPPWYSRHLAWEDICTALFGAAILLSPVIAESSAVVAINAGLFGLLIVAIALLEILQLKRWEEAIQLGFGLWIMASPLLLQYGGDLRMLHLLFGGAVAALALFELWQDRKHKPAS